MTPYNAEINLLMRQQKKNTISFFCSLIFGTILDGEPYESINQN